MIKYSGIYESSTPPTSTKALWVDGGVLKIYKNGSWRPVDDPKSKLTIDSILKAGSTNPVENRAIHSRFIGVDKDIEVNKNNIGVLTGRVNEVDGIAKGAEALAKANEKRINSVEALANANEAKSQDNASKIYTLSYGLADVKNTADGNKHDIESLTNRTIKPIESKVSQLQELNVVYPNNIRNLTTESDYAEVYMAFIPKIGGTEGIASTPHVGYLIKGNKNGDDQDDPDSTIISVEIVKIDDKDCHKFMYIDNNRDLVTMTVCLTTGTVIERSVVSNIDTIIDKISIFDKKLSSGTLRDLYISAGAKYNEATGFYELNGLTDITEEQMRVIYEKTWGWWLHLPSLDGFGSALPRTNIPCPDYKIISYASNISIHSIFSVSGNNDNLEVVNLRALYTPTGFDEIKIVDFNWAFQECKKIREVQGIINVKEARYDLNIGGNIETINIKGLKVNIRFYNSQRLSKESVLYMIKNSEATSAITISLNKAVYDVMKDDADIIAALTEKTNITLVQKA